MRRLVPIALAALVASATAPAAFAATITLIAGEDPSLDSYAYAAADDVSVNYEFPTSVPAAGTPVATHGSSSTVITYSLSNNSLGVTFDLSGAVPYHASSGGGFVLYFSPDTDVDYSLSGVLGATDSEGRNTILQVSLNDMTASTTNLSSFQFSQGTPNESFTVGGLGGDFDNQLFGSLTGTLQGGHNYEFIAVGAISAWVAAATTPAHATGYVTLAFVPEPSMALLCGLGLAGLVARRWSGMQ